jgi:hypothetical protein
VFEQFVIVLLLGCYFLQIPTLAGEGARVGIWEVQDNLRLVKYVPAELFCVISGVYDLL